MISSAQEFSYKHYTVKDGLVSSTIYNAVQDRNGFIWFASNQGVSRYDGHTFRNFTKEDGLPDNEIIKLYVDKHNNVWFISMIGMPSVYINGRIRIFKDCEKVTSVVENFEKDSIYLISGYDSTYDYYRSVNKQQQWKFSSHIQHSHSDNASFFNVPVLRASGKEGFKYYFTVQKDSAEIRTLVESKAVFKGQSRNLHFIASGAIRMFPFRRHSFYSLSRDESSLLYFTKDSIYISSLDTAASLLSLQDLGLNPGTFHSDLISLFYESNDIIWLCTRNRGLLRITNFKNKDRKVESYFKSSYCTSLIKDFQGGYWLSTHNDGVYYLPGLSFRQLKLAEVNRKSAACIRIIDSVRVVVGYDDGNIDLIHTRNLNVNNFSEWGNFNKNNRIVDLSPFPDKSILAGTDKGLFKILTDGSIQQLHIKVSKSIYLNRHDEIVIASASGVDLLKENGNERLFPSRATCVAGYDNKYFWGTFHGAYSHSNGNTKHLANLHPALSQIINHIDTDSNRAVWFSTSEGLVVMKGTGINYINKHSGLPSNFCKHVSFTENTAWVSTDRGIGKIEFSWKGEKFSYVINHITEDDGLISNNVNQTAVVGKNVWAATSTGVCFFSTDFTSNAVNPPLINVTRIINGQKEIRLDEAAIINSNSKLVVDLSPISYHSGKQIAVQYRLTGLDSTWNTIAGKTAEFTNLPFGKYAIEFRAIDRWGNKSKLSKKLFVSHPAPFWKTPWFIITSYLITALLMGFIVYTFNKRNQRKRDKEQQLRKKISDLEMMALRAQMNPHFIFNCLNSIQHHIMRADPVGANEYLHKFSQLIRKTLHYSSSPKILLSEEIAMLALYLDLEKLRLGKKLDYALDYLNHLGNEDYKIPSMVIQPFIENAIKHGISPLLHDTGFVSITFKKSGSRLECTIDDNGVGIKHKPLDADHHIPMGMSITVNRINIMNSLHKDQILLNIQDKRDLPGAGQGTRVSISFSLSDQI